MLSLTGRSMEASFNHDVTRNGSPFLCQRETALPTADGLSELPQGHKCREGVNGNGIHQIKRLSNHARHGCQCARCFREISASNDDFCTCGKNGSSGLKAYVRIASRDNRDLPG